MRWVLIFFFFGGRIFFFLSLSFRLTFAFLLANLWCFFFFFFFFRILFFPLFSSCLFLNLGVIAKKAADDIASNGDGEDEGIFFFCMCSNDYPTTNPMHDNQRFTQNHFFFLSVLKPRTFCVRCEFFFFALSFSLVFTLNADSLQRINFHRVGRWEGFGKDARRFSVCEGFSPRARPFPPLSHSLTRLPCPTTSRMSYKDSN